MRRNLIVDKSVDFAIRIINLRKYLTSSKNEHVLSKQILRSGTSIGANITEGQEAQSKADFISKNSIALKECAETKYWLTLLERTDYISHDEFLSLNKDAEELYAMLVAIIKTAKANINS